MNTNRERDVTTSLNQDDRNLINRLNTSLLSLFRFQLEITPEGVYYTDCRKPKPVRLNRNKPLKTTDEILRFIGIAIQKLYVREADLYRKVIS